MFRIFGFTIFALGLTYVVFFCHPLVIPVYVITFSAGTRFMKYLH